MRLKTLSDSVQRNEGFYFASLCYDQGILYDKELLVLYKQYKYPSLDLPYSSYPLFDIDDMEDVECLAKISSEEERYTCTGKSTSNPRLE